jgi:pectate lyase
MYKNIRRPILLIAFLLIAGSIAIGQVQLSENFDGTFTPVLPTSAPTTQTDYVSSATGTWSLRYAVKYTNSAHSSPNSINIPRTNDGYIITPALNSAGTITVWGLSSGSGLRTITVEKSINGAAYQQVGTITILGNASSWNQGSLAINELSSNIRIKLVAYNATAGGDVRVDDIAVTSYATTMITVSTNSLASFGSVVTGNTSSSSNYTVSGSGLTDDILITAPTGFQVSADNSNFYSSISLTRSGSTVPTTTVYARFAPSSPSGLTNGNISHTSIGAATQNVSVSGTALATEPTVSSSVSFGTVTDVSIVVNFSGGNGDKRVVVVRSDNPVSWAPTDGNAVSGVNANFTTATDQSNGNKVVYDNNGSTVTVTGLAQKTTYYFAVYEYNVGTGNTQNYFTSSPGTGNQTTVAVATLVVTPASLSFSSVEIDSISVVKSYALSGTTLTPSSGNITVTTPTGFEVSLSGSSGFGSSVLVPYSGSILSSTTIYARFKPTLVQSYSGNITNAGGGAITKNVAVSGTGVPHPVPDELQAENGILSSAYVLSDYAGYTGIGYVDIANKTGASLTITFRRATASTDTMRAYYALGGSTRAYNIYLNGSSLGQLSFTSTGSWTTWSSVMMMVAFQAGVNQLKFEAATNTSDNANIDRIYIGGQTATPVYKLSLAASGSGTVGVLPTSGDNFYDVGTSVTLTAYPSSGNMLYHWAGSDQSNQNPFVLTMNSHKTEVGVMASVIGIGGQAYESAPIGFASVGALGYPNGTTGGTGDRAQVVYVTTSDELGSLMLKRDDPTRALNFPPLTVYVVGTLTPGSVVSDMCDVKRLYDVSIIGVGVDATLSGFGLMIVESKNVIVRNLKIQNSPDDGINIQSDDTENGGHHIWIDHCTFTNCYDGALDVTHTTAYATFSWNYFYNHDKACLMGHSDSQTSDVAMKVTYHHNYFDSTGQRHPRVRYGKAHVYNNYYRKCQLYGVSSNLEADVVVEGCYFLDVPIPTETSRDGSPPGDLVERNNIFAGTTGVPGTRGTAFDPSSYYSYTVDPASSIPQMLANYAGSGKFDYSSESGGVLPVQLALFVGSFVGQNVVRLEWETISEKNNFGFYVEKYNNNIHQFETVENSFQRGNGNTLEPKRYSWIDENALGADQQYRLKQIDNDGLVTYFGPISVNPNNVEDVRTVPAEFHLSQNYPNPFNPSTKISFSLDKSAYTTLKVYNLLGKEVATVFNGNAESGRLYVVNFDAKQLSSGLYFYKLQSNSKSDIKKLILLK